MNSQLFVAPPSGRINALDGVRTTAVLITLFGHTYDHQLYDLAFTTTTRSIIGFYQWVTMNVFFILSGFLIAGRIYRLLLKDRFRLSEFYIDRSLRILPAAYFLLLITASPGSIGLNRWTLTTFTYLGNLFLFGNPDHYWSLQVEEQFYMITPLLLMLFFKLLKSSSRTSLQKFSSPSQFCWILGLTIVAHWILRGWQIKALYGWGMPNIHSLNYVDCFLLGLLASVLRMTNFRFSNSVYLTLAICVVSIPLAFLCEPINLQKLPPGSEMAFAFLHPLSSFWAFLLIFMFSTQNNAITRFFGRKEFFFYTTISYSIFLWHPRGMITGFFQFDLRPESPMLTLGLQFMANIFYTSCMGLGSYYFIERPFLILRERLRKSYRDA